MKTTTIVNSKVFRKVVTMMGDDKAREVESVRPFGMAPE